MKIATAFICLALHASLNPAPNYYSWFSPEIANNIIECVVNGEYHEHLDFNGDGVLSVADAVGVLRRYYDNIEYGNELTVDSDTVQSIIEENYNVECVQWEIDWLNGEPCRKYELTVNEITTANIYAIFEDDTTDNIAIEINPFEEIVRVTN